ncbi:MAG: alpha/beta fold hydrolase [Candidatus Bipolaricaulota bacterium]|nr:alpha/beta fold hydrolase [Candidatus Bipolaricaulota bacterium]
MEHKLLIVLAVIGVIILFGLITPPPATERGELIDTGHFVLEQGGVPIVEEDYTLFFSMEGGYMLLSEASLSSGDQTITLAQQYQLDQDFTPVLYHLAADTPSGSQLISAQMGIKGLHMDVLAGTAHQSVDIPDKRNTIILDNNLISHYVVLLIAAEVGAIDRDFTAAVPQALLSLPAHLDGPNTIEFASGGSRYTGKLYGLQLGDLSVSLVTYTDQLVGLFIPAQATVTYNADLFSEGISLVEESDKKDTLPPGVREENVTFMSDEISLVGTLTLPEGGAGSVPGVLFIHGSGPVDRDGNASGLKMGAYRQLAHALAEAGVGSLRYDKRGVGKSGGTFAEASMEDLLSDANAALSTLRSAKGIDAGRCFLVGHSEGGILAPIIASEKEDLAGIVLLAGAAHSLDFIIRGQIEGLNRDTGKNEEEVQATLAKEDQYLDFVRTSEGEWSDYSFDDLKGAMPWLTQEKYQEITALSLSWLREHFLHDPLETIRKVTCPVLIIQGGKDLQVPPDEAGLLSSALKEVGNSDVTVDLIPDLNHLLRHHPEEPNLAYRHLDEPIDPRVVDMVTGWITGHSDR